MYDSWFANIFLNVSEICCSWNVIVNVYNVHFQWVWINSISEIISYLHIQAKIGFETMFYPEIMIREVVIICVINQFDANFSRYMWRLRKSVVLVENECVKLRSGWDFAAMLGPSWRMWCPFGLKREQNSLTSWVAIDISRKALEYWIGLLSKVAGRTSYICKRI